MPEKIVKQDVPDRLFDGGLPWSWYKM